MGKYSGVALSIGILAPFSVYAVGLGKIDVSSNLNQPFRAKIKLNSTAGIPLSQIKVSLADNKAYQRADLERPYFLTKITFKTENINGIPYVVLSTEERVDEPYLQILVDLAWAKGQFYRAYTVLLDPPGYETESISINQRVINKEPPVYTKPDFVPSAIKVRAPMFQAVYGPTVQSDELWLIAKKYQPEGVNIQQVMTAIYLANPKAFINENMNKLKIGQKLKIPTFERIMKVDANKAGLESSLHESAWKEHKKEVKHVLTEKDIEPKAATEIPPTEIPHSNMPVNDASKEDDLKESNELTSTSESSALEATDSNNAVEETVSESVDLVTQNNASTSNTTEFVALHPMIESLLDKAKELNNKVKQKLPTQSNTDSTASKEEKNKSAEDKALETAARGQKLLKSQINSLQEQNELLKQALMTEKEALTKTNSEIRQLNAKLIKYFERNEKGELILKSELSTTSSESSPYTIILLLLALMAIVSNLIIYAFYRAQKKSITQTDKKEVIKKILPLKKPIIKEPLKGKEIGKKNNESKEQPKKTVTKPTKIKAKVGLKQDNGESFTDLPKETMDVEQENSDREEEMFAHKSVEARGSELEKKDNEPLGDEQSLDFVPSTLEASHSAPKSTEQESLNDVENVLEFESFEVLPEEPKVDSTEELAPPKEEDSNTLEFTLSDEMEPSSKETNEESTLIDCATQLALAETYITMGDFEMVKATLEEVLEKGTIKEQEKARKLLSKIEK